MVKLIYSELGHPKESYSKGAQTGVSFVAGYIAGIACAVVSHPADVMVSKLNTDRQGKQRADSKEVRRLTIAQLVRVQGGPYQEYTVTLVSWACGTAFPCGSS